MNQGAEGDSYKSVVGECEECGTVSGLEFAHKEPMELDGWGRGRKERVYDVMKNPNKYRLLCKDCHKEYDQTVEDGVSKKVFKCPYCRRATFDTLGDLGTHLSKTHGINKRRRQKIYKKMGYEEM